MAVANEQGLPLWLGQATVLRGWALAEQGQSEEGINQIRQGLAGQQAMGAGIFHSYCLVLLAETYGKAGRAEEGLAALAEALAVVDKTGERFYEAELYRLRGELTLRAGEKAKWGNGEMAQIPDPSAQILEPKGEAEACFLKAIEVARKQQAKSLELRAVLSLVRLRQQQAAQPESRSTQHEARSGLNDAHRMLSEIYSWFTEGFDTADLKDAQALLAELA